MIKGKKGNISALPSLVIALVVVGIVLAVGFSTLDQLQGTQTSGTYGYNATTDVITSMDDIPGWLPVIVVVAIAGIILLLIRVFRA